MQKTILAISGKPGLYALVAHGANNTLIVETVEPKPKRLPLSPRDRITALNDITVYTTDGDTPLLDVFASIRTKEAAAASISPSKATDNEMRAYLAEVLPNYDTERVYVNDMRKMVRWYNLLVAAGITDFDAPAAEEAAE